MNEKELLEKIQGLIADSAKGMISEKELEAKVAEINKQLEALNNKEDNHAEVKSLKESVSRTMKTLFSLICKLLRGSFKRKPLVILNQVKSKLKR